MKGGRKATPPSIHIAQGTYQPCRHAGTVEIVEPDSLPRQPDWLTDAGRQIWLDDIGRVSSTRLVSESDSTAFANYCNLQGAITLAWQSGQVPPTTALAEVRKMQELFGLGGAKSRLKAANGGKTSNPFSALGKPRA
jgi:hypothetical protein